MNGDLNLRFPEAVKQRIGDAASIRGQTLTEFAEAAVLDRAEEVLRQREANAMAEFLVGVPDDDEPYTEEQQHADAEAWARYEKEGGVAHDELGRRIKEASA